MLTKRKTNSEIWAIGGGKGGTGKSFVISAIGTYLALTEHKLILIDADLGGANLHTFIGIDKPEISLTDFFDNKVPLVDLVIESGIKNMGFLSGMIYSLASDSIKYMEKLKFFRHIKRINTDHILIDLGAGVHFNTIDTFLLADKMIVLTVPEITAIENMYYFLKNVLYRKLLHSVGDYGLKDVVSNTWKNKEEHNLDTINQLIDHLKGLSKSIECLINKELSNFKINIVLNQVKNREDIKLGKSIKSVCKKYFGINAEYVGYIEYDEAVSECVNKRKSYIQNYPRSTCAKGIEKITEKLLKGKYFNI